MAGDYSFPCGFEYILDTDYTIVLYASNRVIREIRV